jgi:arylsulfatase
MLRGLIAIVVGMLGMGCLAEEPARRPNVMVILADDLGYSDLGCYGGEIETPTLDGLARGGLRFTQCYNTARCWPSRAALLTGYYAQAVRRDTVAGVESGSQGKRPAWAMLLPEMLRPHGYRTYHSGKWHVDGRVLDNGFDHSYEIGGGQNNYFRTRGITDDEQPVAQTDDYYVTSAIGEHAVRCLAEHARRYEERPFFHYVCFTSPHFPLHAPAEVIEKYRQRYLAGWNVIQQKRYERQREMGLVSHALPAMERNVGPPYPFPQALEKLGPGEVNRPLPWNELSDEQREFQATKMAIHAAMVDRMDAAIGRIVDQLRAMGEAERTLILFASDNGASAEIMVRGDGHDRSAPAGSADTYLCLGPGWSSCSNTPFRRHKTWVHEGGIATPLIVHWPQGFPARGELRRVPCHVIDFVPTVLAAVGVDAPTTWHDHARPPLMGKSLLPVFAKDVEQLHDQLWWRHEGNRALRRGDWKIVAAGQKAPWELYDLRTDRGETNDLAKDKPELVETLAELWRKQDEAMAELARQ